MCVCVPLLKQRINPSFFLFCRFDAKQAPYRILFQREPNVTCLQIAASDSEETIEEAWDWIKVYLLPLLEGIPGPYAKEEWVIQQMNTIVSSTITSKFINIYGIYSIVH